MIKNLAKILIALISICFMLFVGFGKCYTIEDESENQQIVSLKALDIEEILKRAGISIRTEDEVSLDEGDIIQTNVLKIERAFPVIVEIDGAEKEYYSTAKSVSEFLTENGVTLTDKDFISVSPFSELKEGKIVIKTYKEKEKVVKQPIKYKVVYLTDNRVAKGVTLQKNTGKDGVLEKHYVEIFFGGKKTGEKFLFEKVTKAPENEYYLVGSATPPKKYLAKYKMNSTAYSPTYAETDGDPWTTATGLTSGFGVVAVDPKVIPLGSLLYIDGYGYAVAGDTGGAIKGHKIDVFFYMPYESMKWGRRNVDVYLLPGKWTLDKKLNY